MPLWHDRVDAWHEVLPGVHRRILARSSSVMLVLYRIEPGRVFAKHTHPHVQAGMFLEGGGTFEVGNATWTVGPGDSYSIPPNVPHELRTRPDQPSVILDVFAPEREDFVPEALPPDAD
jgi:quercetin dioxygenase-like cupin family protein